MIIYKIINKINGKIYIGQTKHKLKYRWSGHVSKAKKGSKTPIHCAIRKYGAENFKVLKICSANTVEELNNREIHCIKVFKSLNKNIGYNIKVGGQDFQIDEATKAKISKTLTGRKMKFKDPELRGKNISKSKKGMKLHKNTLKSLQRKVRCIETNTVYDSVTDAAKAIDGYTTNISRQIRGKIKHYKGFTYEYVGV